MLTKKTRASVCAIVWLFGLLAQASCEARGVASVAIEKVGAALLDRNASVAIECKKFRPTSEQIKLFLSKAYPVEERIVMHDYYSPCYSKGTVVFSDKSSATWVVYSSGAASITWGLSQQEVYLFYPKNQWHDPFKGMYGLCNEGDC